ncbi:hypothetical protein [Ochrobactrum sp. MYb379]|uniref:hypothetical protein n=1 Tax=Ochrobactrum sp. MYb379 TaxID=2745275 RepID=UPI00309E822F
MADTYVISFRIADKTVGGKTYGERRESLMEAAFTKGLGYWDATTSFLLVNSTLNTEAFAKKLSAGLDANHDMLVVFDPSDMSLAYFGAVMEPRVLASFFNTVKKLP